MYLDTSSSPVNRAFDAARTQAIRWQRHQPTRFQTVAIWAVAALPMALLIWVLAPIVAHGLHGPQALARGLIEGLTDGRGALGLASAGALVVLLK